MPTKKPKSNRGRRSYGMTLCWDCKNATGPNECPWARDGSPVRGWTTIPTTLKIPGCPEPIKSFHVIDCPRFDRDSFRGGLDEVVFGKKRKPTKLDDKDIVNVAEAICERAVRDWILLDYGQLRTVGTDGSTFIDRYSLLEFFFSRWFETLLESFSYHSPDQIRRYIHITPDMNPHKKRGGAKST